LEADLDKFVWLNLLVLFFHQDFAFLDSLYHSLTIILSKASPAADILQTLYFFWKDCTLKVAVDNETWFSGVQKDA
jgi:hypothetical protein